jgi:hypothetical protein
MRMKKTSLWITDVEDRALAKLSWARSRTRSHIIRMAIRKEAGLEDFAIAATLRGGWTAPAECGCSVRRRRS